MTTATRSWPPMVFWATMVAFLVCDLVSKYWIFAYRPWRSSWIHCDFNPGVAWSMFHQHPELVGLLTLVLVPVLGLVYWRSFCHRRWPLDLGFGAVMGGALGNAWDRMWSFFPESGIRGVRDFIHVDLGFWPLNPWPTFNVADIGITCGFILLLIDQLILAPQKPKAS